MVHCFCKKTKQKRFKTSQNIGLGLSKIRVGIFDPKKLWHRYTSNTHFCIGFPSKANTSAFQLRTSQLCQIQYQWSSLWQWLILIILLTVVVFLYMFTHRYAVVAFSAWTFFYDLCTVLFLLLYCSNFSDHKLGYIFWKLSVHVLNVFMCCVIF